MASVHDTLSEAEIMAALEDFPGWEIVGEKLVKEFKFQDFVEAFGFVTRVALAAEKLNHHPEIYNVYNMVKLELTTHETGGISCHDLDLVAAISKL